MGLLSSYKKSVEIKKITKNYQKNSMIVGDAATIAANEIFNYLSNNKPFKDLMLTDNIFKKINVKTIIAIIKEIENHGYGGPTNVGSHCPAISCFFFPDILYFLIIAHSSNKGMFQLIYDISEYFRKGEIIFKPTDDPRY